MIAMIATMPHRTRDGIHEASILLTVDAVSARRGPGRFFRLDQPTDSLSDDFPGGFRCYNQCFSPTRPHRPEAQDVALSRLKHGFESRRGRHTAVVSTNSREKPPSVSAREAVRALVGSRCGREHRAFPVSSLRNSVSASSDCCPSSPRQSASRARSLRSQHARHHAWRTAWHRQRSFALERLSARLHVRGCRSSTRRQRSAASRTAAVDRAELLAPSSQRASQRRAPASRWYWRVVLAAASRSPVHDRPADRISTFVERPPAPHRQRPPSGNSRPFAHDCTARDVKRSCTRRRTARGAAVSSDCANTTTPPPHAPQRANPVSRYFDSDAAAGCPTPARSCLQVELPAAREPRVRRRPQVVATRSAAAAPARGSIRPRPRSDVRFWPQVSRLRVRFQTMLAAIERPEQHLAHRRRRPAVRPPLLRPRRRRALGVQLTCAIAFTPVPVAQSSKMRRTTAASASLICRSTWDRFPSAPTTSTLS